MTRDRNIRWLVLAVLIAGTAACSAGGSPPPRNPEGLSKQYWKEGGNLARRGKLDEAIRKYEQALEIEPEYVQCLNDLGQVYIKKGWHSRAIGVFERAIQINPDFVDPRAGMAEAYFHLSNYKRCISEASEAIKLSPDFAWPYYWRGLAHQRKGVSEKAESDLELATKKNSRFGVAHLALGEIYAGEGLYAKAEKRYQAALDSGAGIQVYAVWSDMKMRQKDWNAAYELLRRGVSKAPQTSWLRTRMGYVMLARGNQALTSGDKTAFRADTEKAMEQFKTALRFDRTDQDAKNGLEEARRRLDQVQ